MCAPQVRCFDAAKPGCENTVGNKHSLNICLSHDDGPRVLAYTISIYWPRPIHVRFLTAHTNPNVDREDLMSYSHITAPPVPAGHTPVFHGGRSDNSLPT